MKKYTLLALIIFISACSSSRVLKSNEPRGRFGYPLVVESTATFETAWIKLVDYIAIKGLPISRLDKTNGLFISAPIQVPYVIENATGQNADTTATVILPRLRFQQLRGKTVLSSRIVYPDSVMASLNVRIRSNPASGAFVNANITEIRVKGSHYRKKQLTAGITNDTTITAIPVTVKPSDWSSAKSTGKIEKAIIEAIKAGNVAKYQ
jgi:hypothetical protein